MPYVQETYDIPPGEYTTLSFVYREKRQSVCYGWNNESYLHGFKHPQWQLEKGRYIVKLVVKTGGREFTSEFMIFNDGKFDDFRLEMMPRSKT